MSQAEVCIALDAMGGDHGLSVVVPAALRMLVRHPQLRLILVGDQAAIQAQLQKAHHAQSSQLEIQHASQQVGMDESPALALRNKKDSSMRVAINLVKEGRAQACVSAGNTGALMATARFVLKTLPGIDRPAIIARMPTMLGSYVRVLDLGANVDSRPEHLLQFAVMASVLVSELEAKPRPSVGLLNIGHEDIKGNELVKQTSALLQQYSALNYIGYIEADEVFKGKADIIVCDGFVGNVALKTSEGTARLIAHFFKEAFQANIWGKLLGALALPFLASLRRRMDPARYNGASLLGLQGIVVKSHGGTNVVGFANAIEEAMLEVKKDLLHQIPAQISAVLDNSQLYAKPLNFEREASRNEQCSLQLVNEGANEVCNNAQNPIVNGLK